MNMNMNMNKFGGYVCVLCIVLFCSGCFKSSHVQSQPNLPQHQIKLTFKPDEGMAYLTSQEIDKFYSISKSTGMELGYRILQSDQERGQVKFMKEGVGNSHLVNLAVIVSVTDDRQTAYVHIKTTSLSATTAQNAAREYRDKYKSKLLD
jgi:hypothetical protein